MKSPHRWIVLLALLPLLFFACDDDNGDDNPSGTGDTVAPSAVTDLVASDATENSIKLTWTATGDDTTTGTASQYDIRYAEATITAGNWGSATAASGEPNPAASGTEQTFTVTDLKGGTEYFFAMKVGDEVPNMSDLSNVAVDTTLPSSLILVRSNAQNYTIVDPATGEDSVTITPAVGANPTEFVFGYGCRRVYFIAPVGTGGANAIYGCDAFDGANLQSLTSSTQLTINDLDGSPTEEKIVFEATGIDPHYPGTNIFVMDEDGSGLTQLTAQGDDLEEPDGTDIEVIWSYMPLWSPDGTKIAYFVNGTIVPGGGLPQHCWVVMNADGTGKEVVYVYEGTAHYRRGGWSRDGEFLFINQSGNIHALHLATLSASDITAGLGTNPYSVFEIAPSPQTDELAFDRYYPSGTPLFMADYTAAGTGLSVSNSREVVNNVTAGHGFGEPDWAPFYPED